MMVQGVNVQLRESILRYFPDENEQRVQVALVHWMQSTPYRLEQLTHVFAVALKYQSIQTEEH